MTAQKSEEYEALDGGSVKFSFVMPDKGIIHINFMSKNNDYLLHMSIRVNWYKWKEVFVLNSRKADQPWAKQKNLKGFPFKPNQTVHVQVEITKNGYQISANNKKIVEYPGILLPVDRVTFQMDDATASIKAKLVSFEIEY